MRATFVFILLFALLGFFAVVSEAQFIDANGAATIFPSAYGNGGQPQTNFVPVVDVAEDVLLAGENCTDAPRDCSLRAALNMANEQVNPTTITFADHFVINLERPLPTLTQNGIAIIASPGQEVRINGNNLMAPVLHIAAADIRLEGLRIYGAGPGSQTILVNGPAQRVVIARNIIGDDDGPDGMCDMNNQAVAGIYVQPSPTENRDVRAWVYGNIIECHLGHPGDGIVIRSDNVVIGADQNGQVGASQQNVIRHNSGVAVRLDEFGGNTVRNNVIHHNQGGTIAMTNFANNLLDNDIQP